MTPNNLMLEPKMLTWSRSQFGLLDHDTGKRQESDGAFRWDRRSLCWYCRKSPRVFWGELRLFLPPNDVSFVPGKISLEMKLLGISEDYLRQHVHEGCLLLAFVNVFSSRIHGVWEVNEKKFSIFPKIVNILCSCLKN